MAKRTEARKEVQQACVIPFRRSEDQWMVCVVTSRKGRWIFPKGIVDPGETPPQSGLKEAWEEAGLHGQIVGEPLGEYIDQKWGCRLRVQVMLMEVTCEAQDWPEADQRRRQWVSIQEAHRILDGSRQQAFLDRAFATTDPQRSATLQP